MLLAHGALGAWDEVIFFAVIAFLLVMMAISWFRSSGDEPDSTTAPTENNTPDSAEHFKLD
jgi:predicted small integral membrane protein